MTLEYFKEDIATLKESVSNLINDSDEFTDKIAEIWYFIAATVILTFIGFISVLSFV